MENYDDEQILGAHLVHEHKLTKSTDFNDNYSVSILAHILVLVPSEKQNSFG